MCLFCLAYFYFEFIGVCETVNYQISLPGRALTIMSFVSAWAIQDNMYNLGGTWRYNLASYICCGMQTINRCLQNK